MRMKHLIPVALLLAGAASAASIDGTFNYQGRLTSGGAPITGNADVRFSLWDDAVAGVQKGPTVDVLGASVTDGLFNADLDFGVAALNGQQRWLQVEVRSPAGVGSYVNLGRQSILGAPYAIQTRGIFVDDLLNVGIGTTNPQADLHIGGANPSLLIQDDTGASLSGMLLNVSEQITYESYHYADGNISSRLINSTYGPQWLALDREGGGLSGLIGAFGSLGGSGDGILALYGKQFGGPGVWLTADGGSGYDTNEYGLLELGSAGATGQGGTISLLNNSGDETVSLVGGGSSEAGTFTMYNSTGGSIVEMYETYGGGQLRLVDSTNGVPFFMAFRHTEGGGYLNINRNAAANPGFIVDGNHDGTESTLVYVGGVNPGNDIVFNAGGSGDSTVMIPNDAIRDLEIRDESGVASATGNSSVILSGGVDTILSRTITVPETGYCVVIGSCQLGATHTTGTNSDANIGVSDAPGALPANQDVLFRVASGAATGSYIIPATVHGTFLVQPGARTFYLLAQETSGGLDVVDSQLTVLYVPTAYGAVSSTLLARSDGSDASSPRVTPMSPDEIRAEQIEAAIFDQNRRDAELAEVRAQMQAMQDRIEMLEREQDPRPNTQHNDTTRVVYRRDGVSRK